VIVLVALLGAPAAAVAQPSKPPRGGVAWIGTRPVVGYIHTHFVEGMRALGWLDGQNVVIDPRFAGNDLGRLPAIMAELVAWT
jgi:sensor domain CHASE-containing protein